MPTILAMFSPRAAYLRSERDSTKPSVPADDRRAGDERLGAIERDEVGDRLALLHALAQIDAIGERARRSARDDLGRLERRRRRSRLGPRAGVGVDQPAAGEEAEQAQRVLLADNDRSCRRGRDIRASRWRSPSAPACRDWSAPPCDRAAAAPRRTSRRRESAAVSTAAAPIQSARSCSSGISSGEVKMWSSESLSQWRSSTNSASCASLQQEQPQLLGGASAAAARRSTAPRPCGSG